MHHNFIQKVQTGNTFYLDTVKPGANFTDPLITLTISKHRNVKKKSLAATGDQLKYYVMYNVYDWFPSYFHPAGKQYNETRPRSVNILNYDHDV